MQNNMSNIGVEPGGKGGVPLAELLRGGKSPPEDLAILTKQREKI